VRSRFIAFPWPIYSHLHKRGFHYYAGWNLLEWQCNVCLCYVIIWNFHLSQDFHFFSFIVAAFGSSLNSWIIYQKRVLCLSINYWHCSRASIWYLTQRRQHSEYGEEKTFAIERIGHREKSFSVHNLFFLWNPIFQTFLNLHVILFFIGSNFKWPISGPSQSDNQALVYILNKRTSKD
jgi:hypothetical protein